MTWLLRRLVAFVVLSVVLGTLERLAAPRDRRPARRSGYWTDLAHFLFTSGLTQLGLVVAVVPLAVLVLLLVPSGPRLWVASLPGPVQFVLGVLLVDFVGYWRHRAAHSVPFLWRLHAVHHSSEHMDWLASTRLHPLDAVLARATVFVPLFALGFTQATFGAYLGAVKLMGLLFHTGVDWDFGPFRRVFASPAFHHWHHAKEPIDKNFAGQLPLWDWLFGTLHLPEGQRPEAYGTRQPVPEGYLAHMAHPFRT